jgi:branched-subunit amino acid transport protein
MSIWLMMAAAGVLTFATRLSFILLLERLKLPIWFQRSLRFVPLAVLSAILVPELVSPSGTLQLSLRNPQLLSGLFAILVAWRTRNVLLTIILGMAALFLIQALIGRFAP